MPAESATAVAKERVWREHLDKCANMERRHRVEHPAFRRNPFNMIRYDRPLAEPINRRDPRFLDRDKAALGAIKHQLGDRAKELEEEEEDELMFPTPAPGTTPSVAGSAGGTTSLPPISTATGSTSPRKVIRCSGGPTVGHFRPPGETPTEEAPDEETKQFKGMLVKVCQTPGEKYKFPMTEYQELGWIHPKRQGKEDRRFRYGLKNCEITKFAGYVRSIGEKL